MKKSKPQPLLAPLLFWLIVVSLNPARAQTSFQAYPALPISSWTIIADIAEKRVSGVVNISSTKVTRTGGEQLLNPFFSDPFFRDFFGNRFFSIPRERRERSLGSGVIVSSDGLILTNNHVVENADEIMVTLADKRELAAEIVGNDPKSDVAVIRLKGDLQALAPVPIGNSGELRLGEVVLAIGNPFGLDHTVTMGIVSAKGRANVGITDYEDFIQTDAAINPGNSGGALINLKGELVGINTAILSRSGGYQGIGFAIPSNMAKTVMTSLVEHGKVVRGWLGASFQDLESDLAAAMKIRDLRGVLVANVTAGSPAAKAELKRGDVITAVNGEQMTSAGRLRNILATMGAGAVIELNIIRDGMTKTLALTLGALPDIFADQIALAENDGILGGITVAPLNEIVSEKFEVSKKLESGVVITAVKKGSVAEQAGLSPGDVILEINRQEVSSVQNFTKLYQRSKNELLILIYREGRAFYLVLRQ